ncbi:MAG TPA: cytochrome C [Prolixibacteraceae bacterium]|jgi:cytochrome c551/c552|nr:cytochrome C [Prolixibacteraceae bacterium]
MKKQFLFSLFTLVIVSFLSLGAGVLQSYSQTKDLGVGPIKSVKLDPKLDDKMVTEGKGIFNEKCAVCHELDQKKVGPPLRNITKDRAPEYIMNLLLNTEKMQQADPNVKALIKKFNDVVMVNPQLTQPKARSVLEYLRSVAK